MTGTAVNGLIRSLYLLAPLSLYLPLKSGKLRAPGRLAVACFRAGYELFPHHTF